MLFHCSLESSQFSSIQIGQRDFSRRYSRFPQFLRARQPHKNSAKDLSKFRGWSDLPNIGCQKYNLRFLTSARKRKLGKQKEQMQYDALLQALQRHLSFYNLVSFVVNWLWLF